MQEQSTRIHTRVFQRYNAAGEASQTILNSRCPNVMKYIQGDQRLRIIRGRRPAPRLATTNIFASGCSNAELARYLDSIFQTDLNKIGGVTQNIFASCNPKLLSLLQVFLDNGWHPNQVLGPQQEVALHHVQCVQNISILKLLLDPRADPTIARKGPSALVLHYFPHLAPVRRKSGDILDMAARIGTLSNGYWRKVPTHKPGMVEHLMRETRVIMECPIEWLSRSAKHVFLT
ncbi:Ankyrin repeat protein [Apiospora aurea]|uniref:Ankyrin repeat protein n=1 Tax=Apiospora aurea TaxID=335848 RepID=A0ABR1QHZ7_9PEZI